MASGFQTQVQVQPAPAIAGDWATSNPRYSVLAGPGGLVAGPLGATIGLFAWVSYSIVDADGAPAAANNFGAGLPDGIIHREQQGIITAYLAPAGMTIPPGFETTIEAAADIWIVNNGVTPAQPGQKAFATLANGQATFAPAGTSPTGATATTFTIAPETWSATGSVQGNVATLTGVTGTVAIGSTIAGTGVSSGNRIVAQLSGMALGAGTYQVQIGEQNVTSGTALSGAYGLLTVGGSVTGIFPIGGALSSSGSDVSAGTIITAPGTGAGGAGTYYVNNSQTSNSGTLTATTNIETQWTARSLALPGELVKINRIPS